MNIFFERERREFGEVRKGFGAFRDIRPVRDIVLEEQIRVKYSSLSLDHSRYFLLFYWLPKNRFNQTCQFGAGAGMGVGSVDPMGSAPGCLTGATG